MRFLEFLDGLEEIVGRGRKVPGTKKSIVERDEIAEYVDQLRTSVPQELYDANQILNRGESIVKGAESIAKQIHTISKRLGSLAFYNVFSVLII